MAKSKRKPSSAQRNKSNIEKAKKLKAAGIISKQAKLHGGRFISKEVLRKVREYGALTDVGFKAIPVTKATAKAAQERGYQVVAGNKIIGPSTPAFRNRLKKGELTGVKPLRGSYMEEVILPHTVYDMHTLAAQLGQGIDTLKMPGEYFAFKYHGRESYRIFKNSSELLEYLLHYKGLIGALSSHKAEELQEEFEAFTLFRLHSADQSQFIPGLRARREREKQWRMEAIARGEYVPEKRKRNVSEETKKRLAKNSQRKRARMTEAQKAKYREKARERARKSRESKKGK